MPPREAKRLPASLVDMIRERRGQISVTQRVAGEERMVAGWRRRSPPRMRWTFAIGAGMAVIGGAIGSVELWEARSLSYAMEGGHLGSHGAIEQDPGIQATRLHFSDGSDVSLSGGIRATLRRVDSYGVTLALGSGNAQVDITHRPGARWSFEAGPFLINVTGTAFRFGWDPVVEELDVQMERGSVQVTGPLSDGVLTLRSGQHLRVRVQEGETLIRDSEPKSAAAEPSLAPTSSPSAEAPTAPAGIPPSTPPSTPPIAVRPRIGEQDWSALLSSGDFEGIVHQAQRRGIDNVVGKGTSSELAELADAARYSRHDSLARRALLAQRRRFPGSPAAKDAAFLLGRLDETELNAASAIEWYGRYLQEVPNGTYASDALGREMLLMESASMDAQARASASDYLNRFPNGAYSSRAQALVHTR
jgi:TolA-binding protein